MDENSLIAALRKAEAEKFAAVPSEEGIEHAFSDRFQQRMDRLIRMQRQSVWNMVKTPARRSLLLLMILLLTFGVPPEKNPLFRIVQPIPQLNTGRPAVSDDAVPSRPSEDAAQPALQNGAKPKARAEQAEPYVPEEPAAVEVPDATAAPEEISTVPPATARRPAATASRPPETTHLPPETDASEPETTRAPDTTGAPDTEQDFNYYYGYEEDPGYADAFPDALPRDATPQQSQSTHISSVISQDAGGVITYRPPDGSYAP